MGCGASQLDESQGALPNERALAKNASKVVGPGQDTTSIKLLLLGTGGCGKTTFRKQLRSIHGGLTIPQRKESVPTIIDNLVQGAKALIEDAQRRHPEAFKDGKPLGDAARRVNHMDEMLLEIPAPLANDLKLIWGSAEVQESVMRRNEFQLEDCVLEFFPELMKQWPQWGGPNWLPSEQDCVRARVRSTGVAEEHFVVDGVTFKIFDAGGQRSERRKWLYHFDKVTAVLFMTSLTGYCEVLFEDASQNSLVESLELFDNIVNSKWFKKTPCILFLNKYDLFVERYVKQGIPLNFSGLFPQAPESRNPEEAVEWFTQQFKSHKRYEGLDVMPGSLVWVHVTTATDQNLTKVVFSNVKTIVLKAALTESGFSSQ